MLICRNIKKEETHGEEGLSFANLDCANCASKIEAKMNAHPGTGGYHHLLHTRQLRLTAEDPDALIPELQELARTVESDAVIYPETRLRNRAFSRASYQDGTAVVTSITTMTGTAVVTNIIITTKTAAVSMNTMSAMSTKMTSMTMSTITGQRTTASSLC